MRTTKVKDNQTHHDSHHMTIHMTGHLTPNITNRGQTTPINPGYREKLEETVLLLLAIILLTRWAGVTVKEKVRFYGND